VTAGCTHDETGTTNARLARVRQDLSGREAPVVPVVTNRRVAGARQDLPACGVSAAAGRTSRAAACSLNVPTPPAFPGPVQRRPGR
jgi:hypothetical protein